MMPATTLDSLQRHYRKYGCDKKKDGFGKYSDKEYRTWKALKQDSIIEVAMGKFGPALGDREILELVKEMTGNNAKVLKDATAELEARNE